MSTLHCRFATETRVRRFRPILLVLISCFPTIAPIAFAQAPSTSSEPVVGSSKGPDYPTKPIRMVVGFPPGSALDATARAMSGRLAESLRQNVIVDNRPGVGGNIGSEIVARARPDGYTLLVGAVGSMAVNPHLFRNLPYDPIKNFAPVTKAVDVSYVLVLHPSAQANTVRELIALARSRSLTGGSGGPGTPGHLALELFNLMAGIKVVHVPYKGSGPAMFDLIAGNIQLVFSTSPPAIPQINAGRVKALAVTSSRRSETLPNLPTMAEAGVKDFEVSGWHGVFAPAHTPQAIVRRLNAEITRLLALPDVKQTLFNHGVEASPMTPEQFAGYLKSEIAKWGKVVKEAGIRAN